jgi:CheY-like chemotaxis protein
MPIGISYRYSFLYRYIQFDMQERSCYVWDHKWNACNVPKKQSFPSWPKKNRITHGELWNPVENEKVPDFTILMAEDDPDDRFLMEQAFLEIGTAGDLRFVEDGEELIHYLLRSGKFSDATISPRPVLILLDLNMPKKDGRQALLEIKADPDLRGIPVVIWTTSDDREDKVQCRSAGADVFVTKPSNYIELVNSVRTLVRRYSS